MLCFSRRTVKHNSRDKQMSQCVGTFFSSVLLKSASKPPQCESACMGNYDIRITAVGEATTIDMFLFSFRRHAVFFIRDKWCLQLVCSKNFPNI